MSNYDFYGLRRSRTKEHAHQDWKLTTGSTTLDWLILVVVYLVIGVAASTTVGLVIGNDNLTGAIAVPWFIGIPFLCLVGYGIKDLIGDDISRERNQTRQRREERAKKAAEEQKEEFAKLVDLLDPEDITQLAASGWEPALDAVDRRVKANEEKLEEDRLKRKLAEMTPDDRAHAQTLLRIQKKASQSWRSWER